MPVLVGPSRGTTGTLALKGPRRFIAHVLGRYERETIRFLAERLRTARVFMDVGANIGLYVRVGLRKLPPNGVVIAFEPHPHARAQLMALAEHHAPRLIVRAEPLGAQDENAAFAFGPRDGYASAAAEGNDIFGRFEGVGMTEELVQFRSLDSLIEESAVPEPDVVKLDVEGLEADALLGMRDLLTRSHPTLAVEAHSVRLLADTLAVLDDVGYTNVIVARERSTGPWHALTGPEWAGRSHVNKRADSPVSRRTAGAVL